MRQLEDFRRWPIAADLCAAAAKQVPTCGRRSAPLLKAQPADANLRSLFGFAKISLWSPDRNLKTAATDFKEASKGPSGSRARAKRVRGGLNVAACSLPQHHGPVATPWMPMDAFAASGSCGSIFARGPLGPEGSAGPVGRSGRSGARGGLGDCQPCNDSVSTLNSRRSSVLASAGSKADRTLASSAFISQARSRKSYASSS
jgi:hypothetical protein